MADPQDADDIERCVEAIQSHIARVSPRDHELANVHMHAPADERVHLEHSDCASDLEQGIAGMATRNWKQELDDALEIRKRFVGKYYFRHETGLGRAFRRDSKRASR